MNEAGPAKPDQTAHAEFPSTHWSQVISAGNGDLPGGSAALEELCRAYWSPLYSFLRRQGHSPHDAEDLVQGFLARVLAREDLAGVRQEKGRFRTFLLTSLLLAGAAAGCAPEPVKAPNPTRTLDERRPRARAAAGGSRLR